jgi:hypothetical protein
MTTGVATDTAESLTNAGMDPAVEATHGRAFAEDLPSRVLNRDEATVLALAIDAAPDRTYCTTWEYTDDQGVRSRWASSPAPRWRPSRTVPSTSSRGR